MYQCIDISPYSWYYMSVGYGRRFEGNFSPSLHEIKTKKDKQVNSEQITAMVQERHCELSPDEPHPLTFTHRHCNHCGEITPIETIHCPTCGATDFSPLDDITIGGEALLDLIDSGDPEFTVRYTVDNGQLHFIGPTQYSFQSADYNEL